MRFAAARCPDQASPFAKRYQSRVVRHAKGVSNLQSPVHAATVCRSRADRHALGLEPPNLVYLSWSIVLQISQPQSCSAVARCVAARHQTNPFHLSEAMSINRQFLFITTIVEIDRSTHSFGVSNPQPSLSQFSSIGSQRSGRPSLSAVAQYRDLQPAAAQPPHSIRQKRCQLIVNLVVGQFAEPWCPVQSRPPSCVATTPRTTACSHSCRAGTR